MNHTSSTITSIRFNRTCATCRDYKNPPFLNSIQMKNHLKFIRSQLIRNSSILLIWFSITFETKINKHRVLFASMICILGLFGWSFQKKYMMLN